MDLLLQRLIDLADRAGELGRIGPEQVLDPGQGNPGVGQCLDPDQVDHGLRAVPAVPRGIPLGLGEQAPLVIVPDGAHRDPGMGRELAYGEVRHGGFPVSGRLSVVCI